MALTKASLIQSLYERVGFSKKEAGDLVETLFNILKKEFIQGHRVKISGFGNFMVRQKKTRMGRNPQTGESMEISARRVLTFRPSQILRSRVDASTERAAEHHF